MPHAGQLIEEDAERSADVESASGNQQQRGSSGYPLGLAAAVLTGFFGGEPSPVCMACTS